VRSIELTIAIDFLSKISATQAISRHSPHTDIIVKKCLPSYPAEHGGVYAIKTSHVIEAAQILKLKVKLLANGEAKIGVSADELKRRGNSVFTDDLICTHGYAPYSFIVSPSTGEPVRKACCARCKDGLQSPSELEIAYAKQWLQNGGSKKSPNPGALILAARLLGFKTEKPADGSLRLTKLSPESESKALGIVSRIKSPNEEAS
jgi:hypothetical protein